MRLVPALSRPFDVRLASNRFVLLATPAIGALTGGVALIRSESPLESGWWGLSTAGAAFLAWAITRELHPDRAELAVAAALVAPAGLLWGRSDLLAAATVLIVARAVGGTTGRSMRGADVALVAAVGLPVVTRASGAGALGVGAAGLALSAVWHRRRRGHHLVGAAMYLAGATTSLLRADDFGLPTSSDWVLVWLGVAAGLLALLGPRTVVSQTDREGGGVISATRIRLARLVAAAAATAVALSFDPAAMAPVWAALLVVALRP